MKKGILLILLLIVSGRVADAQSVFYNYGYNVGFGKSIATYVPTSTLPEVDSSFNQPNLLTFGIGVGIAAHLLPLGEEMSLGLQSDLNIGAAIEFSDGDIEMARRYVLNVPLLAQFNYGNFSSTKSDKDFGFAFGAGANINYMIMASKDTKYYPSTPIHSPQFVISPAARFSFRWWSFNSRLAELSLTATATPRLEIGNYPDSYSRHLVMLSYVVYPTY